jgi:hypothetical protein
MFVLLQLMIFLPDNKFEKADIYNGIEMALECGNALVRLVNKNRFCDIYIFMLSVC